MIVLIQQSNEVSGQPMNHECWLRYLSELEPMLSYIASSPFLIFLDQRIPSYVADIPEGLRRLHRYQQLLNATHKWSVLHSSWARPVLTPPECHLTQHSMGIKLDFSPLYTAVSNNGGTEAESLPVLDPLSSSSASQNKISQSLIR